ncbi:hypothetical protein RAS1_20940 [Phycisphaerae bacterium RAS1]|nr:hypothetical protein RAS1_20940 [Phycisphaerae bacterium RAS1]
MQTPRSEDAPAGEPTNGGGSAGRDAAGPPRDSAAAAVGGGLFWGALHVARAIGRSVLRAAAGGEDEPSAAPPRESPTDVAAPPAAAQRVSLLQNVTDRLRGAADSYLAAKMDEIEARVDAKLDEIESRIDRKIAELHEQLVEMRDRELRHRLRLLKLTLAFTALVALLSLGYKWILKYWIS